MALVLVGLIFGAFYLAAAIIYLLIEIGLAVERLSKKSRAKARLRQLSSQLGSGTLTSELGPPIAVVGSMGMGTGSRWDSDTEDGETVSTASTSDGGTLSRRNFPLPGRFYENLQSGDPGYHSRGTFQVQSAGDTLPSGQPPAPADVKVSAEDNTYDDAVSSGLGSMGSNDQIPSDEEPDLPDLPPPLPPAHDEVSLHDECNDFYFEE
ncbi:G-coupled protein LPA1 [Bovine papular stomatitis virus]